MLRPSRLPRRNRTLRHRPSLTPPLLRLLRTLRPSRRPRRRLALRQRPSPTLPLQRLPRMLRPSRLPRRNRTLRHRPSLTPPLLRLLRTLRPSRLPRRNRTLRHRPRLTPPLLRLLRTLRPSRLPSRLRWRRRARPRLATPSRLSRASSAVKAPSCWILRSPPRRSSRSAPLARLWSCPLLTWSSTELVESHRQMQFLFITEHAAPTSC